jgi:hypothetical protein
VIGTIIYAITMYSGISFGDLFDLLVEFPLLVGQLGRNLDLYHYYLTPLVVAVQSIKTLARKPNLVPVLSACRDL